MPPLKCYVCSTLYPLCHNIETTYNIKIKSSAPSSVASSVSCSVFSEFLNTGFLNPPLHTTTTTLWRQGQAKSWPCRERRAHSASRKGWLCLTVVRRGWCINYFIYMFQKLSFLQQLLQGEDAQNTRPTTAVLRIFKTTLTSQTY